MRFGVCAGVDAAAGLKQAGFEFVEVNVQGALKPEAPEADVLADLESLKTAALPCLAANCFLPGDLRVTGPKIDTDRQAAYARSAFARAAQAGIRTIVFGSGGARHVPEGFDRKAAYDQLLDFGRLIAPLAAKHEVLVVVEPLNKGDCNIFTTVAECARYVRDIDHPNMRLLVDGYHWKRDNDSIDDLVAAAPLLAHAHIATYAKRRAPGLEACDFSDFFGALSRGGYDGPVSIESGWDDMAKDAPLALAALKQAAGVA